MAAICLVSNTVSDMIRIMKSGNFSYNDGNIYFEVSGSGDPIVFIHGFSLDHRMWQLQVEHLSKTHRVVTYDMRGFGQSSLPTSTYSHHNDLKALLDHLTIEQAYIVGLSLGGEVAIDFALTQPAMVESLALLETSLGGFASTVDWDVHADKVGIEQAKINWLNHRVFSQSIANPIARRALEDAMKDYSGWHWQHNDLRQKLQSPAKDQLNEIVAPTLIAVGEKDLSYYHDIAAILHERIEGSKLTTIAGAGHMVNIEKPDEINSLLSDFITQS
jgi:pimeloyl-ACP methyl ester carboxylesterase